MSNFTVMFVLLLSLVTMVTNDIIVAYYGVWALLTGHSITKFHAVKVKNLDIFSFFILCCTFEGFSDSS